MGKIDKRNISKVTSCWLWRLCLLVCWAWRSCLPVLGWNRQKCRGALTPPWGSDEVMEVGASSYSFFPLLASFWEATSSATAFAANAPCTFQGALGASWEPPCGTVCNPHRQKWVPSASGYGNNQKEHSEITLHSRGRWQPAPDSSF